MAGAIGTWDKPWTQLHVENNKDVASSDCMPQDDNIDSYHPNARDASLGNEIPDTAAWLHHQSPVKINMLTRPVSSHEDPAAGFSFTKPKAMQPLNFSREPRQPPISHADGIASASSNPAKNMTSQKTPPSMSNVVNTAIGERIITDKLSISPKQALAADPVLVVPFPNVLTPSSVHFGGPAANAGDTPSHGELPITAVRGTDLSMSADDTLVESNLNGRESALSPLHGPTGHQKQHSEEHSVSDQIDEATKGYHSPPGHPLRSNIKLHGEFKAAAAGPPKVAKTRRKILGAKFGHNTAAHALSAPNYNEEDLVSMLLSRVRFARVELEASQKTQQAYEVQLQELKDFSNDLYAQVEDIKLRCEDKEHQLSKIKAAKPVWERKLKKLNDFVKGLTNDHNRLRDDARDLREKSSSIFKERDLLMDALQEIRHTSTQQHNKSKQVIIEAHQESEMVGQTVKHQQSELRNQQALLVAERERNNRLEGLISKSAASQEQLSGVLLGHRDTITERINDLLHRTETLQPAAPLKTQDHIGPMLEECVALLQNLRSPGHVEPEDFEKLNDSMRSYFESITRSTAACEHSTSMTEAGHQQLISLVQEELRALARNLTAELTISEQVLDLREIRATLKERLQATESALRDARLESATLQHKDQNQLLKITALETEVATLRQPQDNTQTLLRLQELGLHNSELQRGFDKMQAQAASLSTQVQQKTHDVETLSKRLMHSQAQFEEAQHEIEVVREEKLEVEKLAVQHRESMRNELLKAASTELAIVKSEHLGAMQQLKTQKTPMENKLSHATKQIVTLQIEKENIEKQVEILKSSMSCMQNERQHETAFAGRLRAQLAELEEMVAKRDASYLEIQEELRATVADNRAKDGYIKALQAAKTALHGIVEDSEPRQIDIEEGPQPITEADLWGLFPDTPVAISSISRIGTEDSIRETFHESYESSRQPLSETQSKGKGRPKGHRSGAAFTSTSDHSNKPGQLQRLGQKSAVIPRSILKEPKVDKRDTSLAEVDTGSMTAPKRHKSNMAGLGPVIPDSQSPSKHLLAGRGRKLSIKPNKKTTKDAQMTLRFSQELRRSVDR